MNGGHLGDPHAPSVPLQKVIDCDPDAPEVTDEQMAEAKPFLEAFPALAEIMRKNAIGRPRSSNPKIPVSIRMGQDVYEKLKAAGPNWQTRLNEILRREILVGS